MLSDDFCDLFHLYDGVVVDGWHVSNKGDLFLNLRITEPKSIVRLGMFSGAVNIKFNVDAESMPMEVDSTTDTLKRLIWTFIFLEDKKDSGLSADLKRFGIYMVWDLEKRGILNQSEAIRLLSLWGGVRSSNVNGVVKAEE